jgi:hypothetical protein
VRLSPLGVGACPPEYTPENRPTSNRERDMEQRRRANHALNKPARTSWFEGSGCAFMRIVASSVSSPRAPVADSSLPLNPIQKMAQLDRRWQAATVEERGGSERKKVHGQAKGSGLTRRHWIGSGMADQFRERLSQSWECAPKFWFFAPSVAHRVRLLTATLPQVQSGLRPFPARQRRSRLS